jgi:hypothetical protein
MRSREANNCHRNVRSPSRWIIRLVKISRRFGRNILAGDLAPTRAALYLRVSTPRQAEQDLSIPDQRRQALGFCDVNVTCPTMRGIWLGAAARSALMLLTRSTTQRGEMCPVHCNQRGEKLCFAVAHSPLAVPSAQPVPSRRRSQLNPTRPLFPPNTRQSGRSSS